MFSPPKLKAILIGFLSLSVVSTASDCFAQSAEFEKRAAAMRRAVARGQQSQHVVVETVPAEVIQDSSAYEYSDPVPRVAQAPRRRVTPQRPVAVRSTRTGVHRQSRSRNTSVAHSPVVRQGSVGSYVPQHLRTAQLISDGTIIDGGAPIVGESIIDGGIIESSPGGSSSRTVIHGGYDQDIVVDEGYSVASDYSCDSCGVSGGYFEDSCCGRGGCPDGPCWFGNLGKAFRTGEFFGGAVAFQSPLFTEQGQTPPVNDNQLASDSSFGFYGGFNLGIPLCRLSCGLLSGQFGVRSVTTNFNGNEFSPNDRRQIFVTTGIYRRVDYGLQFGVVADFFHEEWFTDTDLIQLRADIGWVYPAGHTLGFRYATGVKDDTSSGTFNGNDFDNFFQTVDDNFRFYYRHTAAWGGHGEGFVGWAESSQAVVGIDVDLPVTNRVAFQSGFTAYLNDDVAENSNFQGGNLNEGWNLYVGLSFRPSGRARYKSYDRPLFDVADNGTLTVRRQSPELN